MIQTVKLLNKQKHPILSGRFNIIYILPQGIEHTLQLVLIVFVECIAALYDDEHGGTYAERKRDEGLHRGQLIVEQRPRHREQGVGDLLPIVDEQAYAAARLLAKKEGVLAGISSGAALHAAITLAAKEENKGKNIVVLLPDTGDRYLSTPLFQD